MGNHDEALFHDGSRLQPAREGRDRVDAGSAPTALVERFETKGRWRWLGGLPHSHTIGRYTFVHGSTRDPVREYVLSTDGFLNLGKLRAIFDSFDGVTFCGHTHHPGAHSEDLRFIGLEGADELTIDLPEGEKRSSTSGPSASRGTVTTAPATRSYLRGDGDVAPRAPTTTVRRWTRSSRRAP